MKDLLCQQYLIRQTSRSRSRVALISQLVEVPAQDPGLELESETEVDLRGCGGKVKNRGYGSRSWSSRGVESGLHGMAEQ